ncbi:MAG: hypothetical protein RR599_04460 [Victivallaceae bacterium]
MRNISDATKIMVILLEGNGSSGAKMKRGLNKINRLLFITQTGDEGTEERKRPYLSRKVVGFDGISAKELDDISKTVIKKIVEQSKR